MENERRLKSAILNDAKKAKTTAKQKELLLLEVLLDIRDILAVNPVGQQKEVSLDDIKQRMEMLKEFGGTLQDVVKNPSFMDVLKNAR